MAHEYKLAVFQITLKPLKDVINTNRMLFRCITGQNNDAHIADNVLFLDLFKAFISALDKPEMYTDGVSKKSMTANQSNIQDSNVEPNIILATEKHTIHGVVEGGGYGRKRKKTATKNKLDKTEVSEDDAITDDFYFLMYMPPASNKSVLMIQSFTDETIDAVAKKFWMEFLSVKGFFDKPKVTRHYPEAIVRDFKKNSLITQLDYSTTLPGETLIDEALTTTDHTFKVTIKIEPTKEMTVEEFNKAKEKLAGKKFGGTSLGNFLRKKGVLKDKSNEKTTPFEMDSDFNIQPTIFLNKYVDLRGEKEDYKRIEKYCFDLLNKEIIPQIYPINAVVER